MEPIDSRGQRLERALAAQDMGRVYAQLVAYGCYRARSRDIGEELADKVLAAAIDPGGSPWNPDLQADFFKHLVGRFNGALAAERKKEKLRRDPTVIASIMELFYRLPPTPEAVLERKQRFEADERRWRALRGSFCEEGDALARGILDQYEDGTTDAATQAQAMGADVRDVYAQRKRIARRALALRAADPEQLDPGTAPAIAALAAPDDEAGR